jgi:hypothetical protein
LSDIVSVRFDLKGLLVRAVRFELLIFFFIGAGLLEDWRNEDVRRGMESAIGLGRGDAWGDMAIPADACLTASL